MFKKNCWKIHADWFGSFVITQLLAVICRTFNLNFPLPLHELIFFVPFTTFVPCLPKSKRKILSIINTDTSHMSLFNHSKTLRAKDLKFWENYHQILCVLCPVSLVRCHMSLVTFFLIQSCDVSLLRVCYQRGVSGLVFRLFLLKTHWQPIFSYIGL